MNKINGQKYRYKYYKLSLSIYYKIFYQNRKKVNKKEQKNQNAYENLEILSNFTEKIVIFSNYNYSKNVLSSSLMFHCSILLKLCSFLHLLPVLRFFRSSLTINYLCLQLYFRLEKNAISKPVRIFIYPYYCLMITISIASFCNLQTYFVSFDSPQLSAKFSVLCSSFGPPNFSSLRNILTPT